MNTLATREQSEAIRKQMRSIRSDLPYAMDDARENLQQLTDWKYYVRQLPLATIAAAFAIGYVVVPVKPKRPKRETESLGWLSKFQPKREPVEEPPEPEQASFFGGLMGRRRRWRYVPVFHWPSASSGNRCWDPSRQIERQIELPPNSTETEGDPKP